MRENYGKPQAPPLGDRLNNVHGTIAKSGAELACCRVFVFHFAGSGFFTLPFTSTLMDYTMNGRHPIT
jgi:hypothetical protein